MKLGADTAVRVPSPGLELSGEAGLQIWSNEELTGFPAVGDNPNSESGLHDEVEGFACRLARQVELKGESVHGRRGGRASRQRDHELLARENVLRGRAGG